LSAASWGRDIEGHEAKLLFCVADSCFFQSEAGCDCAIPSGACQSVESLNETVSLAEVCAANSMITKSKDN
jgi:hypothetical protein